MIPQLYRWIKKSKVRGRIRGKTLTIFDPHVRAAVQDTDSLQILNLFWTQPLPLGHRSFSNGVLWAVAEHHGGFYLGGPSGSWVIADSEWSQLCLGGGNSQQRLVQGVMDRATTTMEMGLLLVLLSFTAGSASVSLGLSCHFTRFFLKPPHWY